MATCCCRCFLLIGYSYKQGFWPLKKEKKINVDTVVSGSLSPRAMVFSSDAGTWAQTIHSSVCVCVCRVCLGLCISLLMGAWNRSKARRPVVCRSSSMSYPQPFDHLHPARCVCQHYGCMHVWFLSTCRSFPRRPPSQRAGHLSVIHLVPRCCWGEKLIPREANPQDLEGLKMVPWKGQNAEYTYVHLEGNKPAPIYTRHVQTHI